MNREATDARGDRRSAAARSGNGAPPRDEADLIERREQLRMRSDVLRHRLAFRATRLQPAFRATDRAADGLNWVRRHPGLVLVAGAAMLGAVVARPRAFMRLGTRAFAAWQIVQRTQPMVRAFMRNL